MKILILTSVLLAFTACGPDAYEAVRTNLEASNEALHDKAELMQYQVEHSYEIDPYRVRQMMDQAKAIIAHADNLYEAIDASKNGTHPVNHTIDILNSKVQVMHKIATQFDGNEYKGPKPIRPVMYSGADPKLQLLLAENTAVLNESRFLEWVLIQIPADCFKYYPLKINLLADKASYKVGDTYRGGIMRFDTAGGFPGANLLVDIEQVTRNGIPLEDFKLDYFEEVGHIVIPSLEKGKYTISGTAKTACGHKVEEFVIQDEWEVK